MRLTGRVWWTAITALAMLCTGVVTDYAFLRVFGVLWLFLIVALYFYNDYQLKKWRAALQLSGAFENELAGRVGEPIQLLFDGAGLIPGGLWSATVEPVVAGRFAWDAEKGGPWRKKMDDQWERTLVCVPGFAGFIEILGFRINAWDPFGWHEAAFFVPFAKRLAICPARLAARGGNRGGKKHSNILWKPGLFQIDRSGQSLEFLGLRELIPGDSPRRIAWKQSLRRDTLLVRETEWEVPVAVNCLVDAGPANRFRHDGLRSDFDDLQPLIMTAAQAAMDSQNPFSLNLIDPGEDEAVPYGVGKIHLTKVELAIARRSAAIPPNPLAPPDSLLPQAELLLESLFPSEMDPSVNRLPAWYAWVEGFPAWSDHGGWKRKLDARRYLFWFAGPLGWTLLPFVFGLTEKERKLSLARKRIALLLCSLGKLPAGDLERLLQDDGFFSETLTNQLGKMGLTIPAAGEEPVNSAEQQARVGRHLAGSFLRRLARARDQQVFLVMIQSGSLLLGLNPLLDAIRRAAGHGHRVIVLDLAPAGRKRVLWPGVWADLGATLSKAGAVYYRGSAEEIGDRFQGLIRKEGFLARRS